MVAGQSASTVAGGRFASAGKAAAALLQAVIDPAIPRSRDRARAGAIGPATLTIVGTDRKWVASAFAEDEALQRAAQELRKDARWRSPAFRAPFSIIGVP